MEYDPASPTDEVEDCSTELDLATIPLPESAVVTSSIKNVIDIPLPPQDFMAADIPLPPPAPRVTLVDHHIPSTQPAPPETPDHTDVDNAPLKFSIRMSSKPIGQENFGESSGVFESSKESKAEEPRSMPKLQALMKRSKPSQLPVGVLPSKIKLPAAETKTELFLPSKESDVNGPSANSGDSSKVTVSNSLPNLTFMTLHSGLSAASLDFNGFSSKDASTTSSTSVTTHDISMFTEVSTTSSTGLTTAAPSVTAPNTAAHIPNLMSLSVQPVQSLSLGPPANTLADPSAVLRQTKMTLANMQYVNPQKLRSAQMIATPLIANPAIAAQPHHDDQSKSRDSRRRSRSRSRRSRSGRRSSASRGRRRRSSSSSDSSPPRRSPRRYQRRSRSRRSSGDRYSRRRTYSRTRIPDRRDYDRRRDRLNDSDSRRNHRDTRVDKRPRSPTPKDRKHTRRRSSSHDRSAKSKLSKRSPDRRESRTDRSNSRKQEVSKSAARKKHSPSPRPKSDSSSLRRNPDASTRKSAVSKNVHSTSQSKKTEERRGRAVHSSDSESASSSSSDSSEESSHETNERSDSKRVSPPSKRQTRHTVSGNEDSVTSSPASGGSDHESPESHSRDKDLTSEGVGLTATSSAEMDLGTPANDITCATEKFGFVDSSLDDNSKCGDVKGTSPRNNTHVEPLLSCEPLITEQRGLTNTAPSPENLEVEPQYLLSFVTPGQTPDSICDTSAPSSVSSVQSVVLKEPGSPALSRTRETKYDLRERKTKQNHVVHEQLQALLFAIRTSLPSPKSPSHVFDAYPDAPRPQYIHVLVNDYSHVEGVTSASQFGASLPSLLGSSDGQLHNEMRCWVCDCTMPSLEEASMGLFACGPGCINRALNIECGSSCPAGKFCTNRQFQDRLYASVEPFYAGPCVGWGLRATAPIKSNRFVIEYVGEVIDFAEFRRRVRRYERVGHVHHYFMSLESDRFIDAGTKGNWARFVNHSCEPNCVTQKWSVDGQLRIGFFALKDIPAGTELTIDYQFAQFGASEQKCYCGTPSCTGLMGVTNKNLQEKVRLKDTSMVERRVLQLLEQSSFEHANDITLLLQVLVQECLTRYTRVELLRRLEVTESVACLKLFRQYNGLDMLGALMCDSDPNDWELKRILLLCLNKIPVSEQKQLQSNSRLFDIVTQWSVDPRYCRPRSGPAEADTSFDVGATNPMESISNTTVARSTQNQRTDQASPVHVRAVTEPLSVLERESDAAHRDPDLSSIPNGGLSPTTTAAVNGEMSESNDSVRTSNNHTDGSNFAAAAATDNERSENDWIQEIRHLAAKLIEKWSKLPVENYRIPRTERQETEKELHVANPVVSSSLISWGHNDNEKSPFSSWTNASFAPAERSKRALPNGTSDLPVAASAVFTGRSLRVLSKSERRKLFEARVKAAEAKKVHAAEETDKTPSELQSASIPSNSTDRTRIEDAENVRHLLLLLLLNELNISGVSLDQVALPGLDSRNAAKSLQAVLLALPGMLSNFPAFKDLSALTPLISRLCEELVAHTAKPTSPLPPGWQSARDPAGLLYYYNMEAKVVQREHPSGKRASDEDDLGVRRLQDANTVFTANDRAKAEKAFTTEVGTFVLRLLRPYRLPNCLTGRIQSSSDLAHIARKLTHAFVSKELKQIPPTQLPTMTTTLQDHIRSVLTRYMTSRGAVYKRRNKGLNSSMSSASQA